MDIVIPLAVAVMLVFVLLTVGIALGKRRRRYGASPFLFGGDDSNLGQDNPAIDPAHLHQSNEGGLHQSPHHHADTGAAHQHHHHHHHDIPQHHAPAVDTSTHHSSSFDSGSHHSH